MKTLKELEQEAVLERLKYFAGNRMQTAKSLGIAPKGLRHRLKKFRAAGVSPEVLFDNRDYGRPRKQIPCAYLR